MQSSGRFRCENEDPCVSKATSLRAKRSNPECRPGEALDCFGACGPRNDGCSSYPVVAMRWKSPLPAGGIGTPPSAYSFSLLRKVRIEMPRMLAAWVRLPPLSSALRSR